MMNYKPIQVQVAMIPLLQRWLWELGYNSLEVNISKIIANIFGMSAESAVNRIINNFLFAADSKLEIEMLSNRIELVIVHADDWNSLSRSNYIFYYGVVGAIDGWLVTTEKPLVTNAVDYFSGHFTNSMD